MSKDFFATYDSNRYYLVDSAFMIHVEKEEKYIKSLSAILSSNVLNFYMKLLADVLRGKTLAVKKIYVEQLPIVELDENIIKKLSEMVNTILTLKQQYKITNTPTERKLLQKQVDVTDKKINDLIYELYDLTEEEIKIIEENI